MKIFSSKKRVAVIGAVTAVTLVGGGTAFAYWTASGTGSGTVAVGSTADWTVAQTSTDGTMYPGVGTATVTFTATNDADSGFKRLASTDVTATIDDDAAGNIMVGSPAAAVAGCLASWFVPTVDVPTPVWDTDVAQGGTVSIPVDVTMTNAAANQDDCKGQSPNLTLTITAAP
jgi:hypothetical protein